MGKINEKMMSSKIVKKEGGFVFDYSSFENLLQKIGLEYLC